MPNAHPRPWHRGSTFSDGLRVPMCRERRAVWRARLTMFRRGRKITPLFEDIGLAMLRRLSTDGRLDPSHRTLADDAGCDPRSVQRALIAFRQCGLVLWVRRIARDGWRTSQISNSYALAIGELPAIPVAACDRQPVRATLKDRFIPMQRAVPDVMDCEKAKSALMRVAASRQAALVLGRTPRSRWALG
jgi:hypothetical protein